jgi:ATP/maltotriose-dependent transcriptional regulator MalT
LKEFKDAQVHYRSAIKVLDETQMDDYWKYCIMGNLALARMQSGEMAGGEAELERVKEIIRLKSGTEHYDYVFLQTQQEAVRNRQSIK